MAVLPVEVRPRDEISRMRRGCERMRRRRPCSSFAKMKGSGKKRGRKSSTRSLRTAVLRRPGQLNRTDGGENGHTWIVERHACKESPILSCYSTTGRRPLLLYTAMCLSTQVASLYLSGLVSGKRSVLYHCRMSLGLVDVCVARQSPQGENVTEINGEIEGNGN